MDAFWKVKALEEMTHAEWEALCDGCGCCCLNKLEDEDSGELFYTNVACHLLNLNTCCCKIYKQRQELVPNCLVLQPGNTESFKDLPSSCAYRRLAEGSALAWWHPLVSGDPNTVHEAGISVANKAVSEDYIHPEQLPEHIIILDDAI